MWGGGWCQGDPYRPPINQYDVDATQVVGIEHTTNRPPNARNNMRDPAPEQVRNLPLLKPEQVKVGIFQGGIAEGRSKFLEWVEQVRDRVLIYSAELTKKMTEVETLDEPISVQDINSMFKIITTFWKKMDPN